MTETVNLLSERDEQRLVLALARERGAVGVNATDAAVLLSWANHARFQNAMVGCVLKGAVSIDVREGEVVVLRKDNSCICGHLFSEHATDLEGVPCEAGRCKCEYYTARDDEASGSAREHGPDTRKA